MNKNILSEMIFGAALLLLAACTQDELTDNPDALPPGKYPLEIGSVTISAEVDSQPWGAQSPQTRVNEDPNGANSGWDTDDEFYVKFKGSDDVGTYYIERLSGSLVTIEASTPVYWPSASTAQNIIAWHAPDADADGKLDLSDQSSGIIYVMRAEETATYNDLGGAAVSLDFEHQLAKVRVKLTGEKAGNVNDVKIESYTSCTVTEGTVSIAGAQTGDITMRKTILPSGGTECWEATVVPGKTIEKFKVNNGEWVALSTEVTPVKGQMHEITIDVKKASLKPVDGKFTVNGGDDVLIKDYVGTEPIVVNGNATITLDNVQLTTDGTTMEINNGATVTLNVVRTNNSLVSTNGSGIGAHENCNIVINGNGTGNSKLTVSAGEGHNVGIGFITVAENITYNYGDIEISDVTLSVTASAGGSGTAGAAIGITGSVYGWANRVNCGNITISNSNVIANSKGGAAGIGTGLWSQQHLSMGVISIAGSTVTVTCGDNGFGWYPACIGMGVVECGTAANGGVTIEKIEIANSTLSLTTGSGAYKVGKGTFHSGTATITDGIYVDENNKGNEGWNP